MNRLRAAFRTILAELNTPSSQRDQWFLWSAAQMAHALIGVVIAGGLLFVLPPWCAFATATIGYALGKELPDFYRAPSWATARDSIQDALFVAAGAALVVAIAGGHERLFMVAVIAAALGLAWGAFIRLQVRR
ncbi:MAG: hypothetical protein ACK5X3_01615 [Pseudomonadota bacterium]